MQFIKFTERNDWEGETWRFYLQAVEAVRRAADSRRLPPRTGNPAAPQQHGGGVVMEMPCVCPGCGEVVELNDMRRDPYDPTRTGLVCADCADSRAAEPEED